MRTSEYTIHQIQLERELRDQINTLGWSDAERQFPKVRAYLKTTAKGSESWEPEMFEHYEAVARIAPLAAHDDLDGIFEIGNVSPEKGRIEYLRGMHSISVGDLIETPTGLFYMVEPFGFISVAVSRPTSDK